MALSRSNYLNESQKYLTIAIDGYKNKELQGRIYHKVLGYPEDIHNLMDMVALTEEIFNRIKYPVQTFDERYFKRVEESVRDMIRLNKEPHHETIKGKIATVRLYITHRFNATWQGEIFWIENNQTEVFESFLELLNLFDRKLESLGIDEQRHQDEGRFNGVMDLMRILRSQLEENHEVKAQGWENHCRMIPGQVFKLYRSGQEQTTFLIRLLFMENHSWQGTIQWKERNEQASFRSFLELVKLMDINLGGWNTWNAPQEWETEKYYWNYS